jgi:hypothetical protein
MGVLYPVLCCGNCTNGVLGTSGGICCPHSANPDCREEHSPYLCCPYAVNEQPTKYTQAKQKTDEAHRMRHLSRTAFERMYWGWVLRYWRNKINRMSMFEALEPVNK